MNAKELKDFEKLIKVAKKNKITHLKYKDIEVTFCSQIQDPRAGTETESPKASRSTKETQGYIKEEIMSDEDMLLYSTPFYQSEKAPQHEDTAQ